MPILHKKLTALFLAGYIILPLSAETLLESKLQTADDLKGWMKRGKTEYIKENVLAITSPAAKSSHTVGYSLDTKKIAGKRVTVTAEVKRDLTEPSVRWQGGKLQIAYQTTDKKWNWPGILMRKAKCDWEKLTLVADMPYNLEKATLTLGYVTLFL